MGRGFEEIEASGLERWLSGLGMSFAPRRIDRNRCDGR
jgi:hypothetical protein